MTRESRFRSDDRGEPANAGRADLAADDRGVSVTVNYALNLLVATLLVGGVLTATAGMIDDRRTSAVRTELEVVGERVAADLMAADRLAQAGTAGVGSDPTVTLSVALPERVAGTRYEVAVENSPSRIVLTSDHPDVEVTVGFHHDTAVAPTTVNGGDLRIVLTGDGDLEVTEA